MVITKNLETTSLPRQNCNQRFDLILALLLLVIITFVKPIAAQAEISYQAQVDQDRVSLNQPITLTVTITYSQDQPLEKLQLPDMSQFSVVSRRSSEQMAFSFGGGASSFKKIKRYNFTLMAKQEGQFTIGPGFLSSAGKKYSTQPLEITVSQDHPPLPGPPQQQPYSPGRQPSPSKAPSANMPRGTDLYLSAQVDKKEVFLGQQVTYLLKLYSRIDLSSIDNLQMPKMEDFWSEEIESPERIAQKVEYIKGIKYNSYLLRRKAIFPIKSGQLTIPPAGVEISTGYSFFMPSERFRRVSDQVTLQVKPLPSQGRPANFSSNNVGEYFLQVYVKPKRVAAGKPVTLKIRISGAGNISQVTLPQLPFMGDFKVYDPTLQEKQGFKRENFGGEKTAEYLLLPLKGGDLTIPPFIFNFFDPQKGEYRMINTEAIHIYSAGAALSQKEQEEKTSLANPADDRQTRIRPIIFNSSLNKFNFIHHTYWYWVLIFLPLGLYILALSIPIIKNGLRGILFLAAARSPGVIALKKLRKLNRDADKYNQEQFFSRMAKIFSVFLQQKFNLPVQGLTMVALNQTLKEKGISPQLAEEVITEMEGYDFARFAPAGSQEEEKEKAWNNCRRLVLSLEKS